MTLAAFQSKRGTYLQLENQMKLIKACRVYAAELPPVNELEPLLEANKFTELTEQQGHGAGFITLPNGKYILDFDCGFAFKLRYDEKILPTAVVNSHAAKRIEEIEDEEGRKLPKKERARIKEEVLCSLLPVAFIKEQTITCFYWKKDNLLIVPTAGTKLADIVTSRLIRSVGSIKTRTIHVDGVKQSLNVKLRNYLENEINDSGFEFDSTVKLKADEGRVTTIKGAYLSEAKEGIIEAMDQGAWVVELGLSTESMFFRLSHDFVIRGVSIFDEGDEPEFEDDLDSFQFHAGLQTTLMADAILKLMALFEYKSPEDDNGVEDYV
jgi:recombination associated protein RdgC